MIRISRKHTIKKTTNPPNHDNEQPLAYISTYNKNNPVNLQKY